jgi:predicted ArsR family transcriptional regulator
MWAAVSDHHQATSVDEVARRIVDALRRRGGPSITLSQRDLKRALGASAHAAFNDAIKFLRETEIIEVENVAGNKGRPRTMYRLRDLSAYRS